MKYRTTIRSPSSRGKRVVNYRFELKETRQEFLVEIRIIESSRREKKKTDLIISKEPHIELQRSHIVHDSRKDYDTKLLRGAAKKIS
ncbi:hypothetical protein CDAR_67111 [Caerostris darwini]|uniref:Uncharacterized protein n=1 Tax=Caerostris darwini TaxID=1538125 RepID=A0AAV4QYX5_9ARAC|nr:hypothetical protein CDAR_67111 [Caerostris darwini]